MNKTGGNHGNQQLNSNAWNNNPDTFQRGNRVITGGHRPKRTYITSLSASRNPTPSTSRDNSPARIGAKANSILGGLNANLLLNTSLGGGGGFGSATTNQGEQDHDEKVV